MIEGTGAVTASDIWSLGCLVIELIQGNPPYFHLPGLTACFRMVQDEHPPIPDDISEEVTDFLKKCFNKDINKRATAIQLMKHPWILKHKVNISEFSLQKKNTKFCLFFFESKISKRLKLQMIVNLLNW